MPIMGQTDSEFDFRFFKWHRIDQARRTRHSLGTSQAAEALLDLGAFASTSRTASPEPDAFDAGNVFGPEDYGDVTELFSGGGKVSPFNGTGGPFTGQTTAAVGPAGMGGMPLDVSGTETATHFFGQHAHTGARNDLGDLQANSGAVAPFELLPGFNTPHTQEAMSGVAAATDGMARWGEAGYHLPERPILPPTGLDRLPFGSNPFAATSAAGAGYSMASADPAGGVTALGSGPGVGAGEGVGIGVGSDTGTGSGGAFGGDDFNRFLEHAGYASHSETDPFGWLGLGEADKPSPYSSTHL